MTSLLSTYRKHIVDLLWVACIVVNAMQWADSHTPGLEISVDWLVDFRMVEGENLPVLLGQNGKQTVLLLQHFGDVIVVVEEEYVGQHNIVVQFTFPLQCLAESGQKTSWIEWMNELTRNGWKLQAMNYRTIWEEEERDCLWKQQLTIGPGEWLSNGNLQGNKGMKGSELGEIEVDLYLSLH